MEKSLQLPCFLVQLFFLNALCFHVSKRQWSFKFSLHITHTSNRVSFSCLSLRIESVRASVLARHWSFAGAPLFLFPILLLRASRSFTEKRLAARFDPSIFRISSRLLTLKTTVPWQGKKSLKLALSTFFENKHGLGISIRLQLNA